MSRFPGLALAIAFCASCAPLNSETVSPTPDAATTFLCDQQQVVLSHGSKGVQLKLAGKKARDMVHVRTASGVRYESLEGQPQLIFWEKGDEARLSVGRGSAIPCMRL